MENPGELTYRPGDDAPSVLRAVMSGLPVFVESDSSYFTLFHVLDRRGLSAKLALLRKRVAPGRWRVFTIRREVLAGVGGLN